MMVKAQVLSGKRAERGLIIRCSTPTDALVAADSLFRNPAVNAELDTVLVEPVVERSSEEYYLAIAYDTRSRAPTMVFHREGGTGVEHRRDTAGNLSREFQEYVRVTASRNLDSDSALNVLRNGFSKVAPSEHAGGLASIADKLWRCFYASDCIFAEINPLVLRSDGTWCALDAKVELDADAAFRHERTYSERHNLGRLPTPAELAAWQIDRDDHRGVAGSSYIDLDGDIAVLASGGGASLAAMDALLANGGRPANYTEYSGNPPRDKVRRLTEIVLRKPNLSGCWVVGATANFTDIFETLSGFLDGLRALPERPRYPILIRRAGPHDREAFEALREAGRSEGYDFHLFGSETPMLSTAKRMVELATAYRNGRSA